MLRVVFGFSWGRHGDLTQALFYGEKVDLSFFPLMKSQSFPELQRKWETGFPTLENLILSTAIPP